MATTANQSQDGCYISLLGLAEYYRTANPPNIKKCIQTLQALFTFKPPLKVEARTHLQMGQILMNYTHNVDLAKCHLEHAWKLCENILGFDDVKFDSASLLAQLCQQQNEAINAKQILRKAIELSQHNCYWHCKLIIQLAQLHASERKFDVASELLAVGSESLDDSPATAYLKVLLLLSRAMMLMIERKTNEITAIFSQASAIIDNCITNVNLKDYVKVILLVLQVSYHLALGQVKTAKPNLKSLQQNIQAIIGSNFPSDEVLFGQNQMETFMWLPKEQLYVLVYLLTVSHSMMIGYMDKALKHTEKALQQIDKLKIQENKPILSVFQTILLEHIIMCRLITGNNSVAIKEISLARDVCLASPDKQLIKRHSAQLHCLLGLYAMSTNFYDHAEKQFRICIHETTERDLKLFANLNLAIVLLRTNRESDLRDLLDLISADHSQLNSQALMGGFYYVQGLNSFHKSSFHEAKRFLRETLKMANAEDLNRLTSCSLVLLSHVFLSIGNSRESMNMVTPAMQLASKIPDIYVQLWGNAIMKDLHHLYSNDSHLEKEAFNNHVAFSQNVLNDHMKCTAQPEHLLLNWFGDDQQTPLTASTSTTSPTILPPTSIDVAMPSGSSSSYMSSTSTMPY